VAETVSESERVEQNSHRANFAHTRCPFSSGFIRALRYNNKQRESGLRILMCIKLEEEEKKEAKRPGVGAG
jgi:hypothetical protein